MMTYNRIWIKIRFRSFTGIKIVRINSFIVFINTYPKFIFRFNRRYCIKVSCFFSITDGEETLSWYLSDILSVAAGT